MNYPESKDSGVKISKSVGIPSRNGFQTTENQDWCHFLRTSVDASAETLES
jgi:hypothetical protein